jgi:hypothetical protein
MLMILLTAAATGGIARGAWALYSLWRALPRSNADFGLWA